MDTNDGQARDDRATATSHYLSIQRSPAFRELRRRTIAFVLPATAGFFGFWVLFILLAGWAPGLLGLEVIGNVNLGMLLGVGQIVSTFAITGGYLRYAARRLDPLATRIRTDFGRISR